MIYQQQNRRRRQVFRDRVRWPDTGSDNPRRDDGVGNQRLRNAVLEVHRGFGLRGSPVFERDVVVHFILPLGLERASHRARSLAVGWARLRRTAVFTPCGSVVFSVPESVFV